MELVDESSIQPLARLSLSLVYIEVRDGGASVNRGAADVIALLLRVFDEVQLRTVEVDEESCPLSPWLRSDGMKSGVPRRSLGDAHRFDLTVKLVDVIDADAAHEQEADLTADHGVLRITGLISVSAPTVDDLDAAVAAVEQAAIQASCETRRLVGQQAVAFTAAALPLCRAG